MPRSRLPDDPRTASSGPFRPTPFFVTDSRDPAPPPPPPAGDGHHFPGPGTLDRSIRLVRYLRSACPWDGEQTARSLVPYLLEESHEVVDAIHADDPDRLEDELGDLLLNLAFQIVVAEEAGDLDAASVYGRLERKMIRRHPQLFGDGEARSWAEMKAEERAERGDPDARPGLLEGLASGLDPVSRAFRLQERAASVGFDWDDHHGPAQKVSEELAEALEAIEEDGAAGGGDQGDRGGASSGGGSSDAVSEEIGDLLFAVVNLARLAGSHPVGALAHANAKFERRFGRLEALAAERGVDLAEATLEEMDCLWDEVKAGEAASPQ